MKEHMKFDSLAMFRKKLNENSAINHLEWCLTTNLRWFECLCPYYYSHYRLNSFSEFAIALILVFLYILEDLNLPERLAPPNIVASVQALRINETGWEVDKRFLLLDLFPKNSHRPDTNVALYTFWQRIMWPGHCLLPNGFHHNINIWKWKWYY